MRLFYAASSPYVRKVMVLLHETDQLDAVELVSAYGTPLDPQTMPVAQNPLAKLPTLERPDGGALYDSRVICRYLDERAGGRLYPAPPRLWETLVLEATADGIMDAALLMVYERRLRPTEMQIEEIRDAQWGKICRALDVLNSRWMSHLAGHIDMGQIATGCALGYLDFRHQDRDWRDARPALADWFTRFGARPSMQATVPVG